MTAADSNFCNIFLDFFFWGGGGGERLDISCNSSANI